MSDDPLQDLIDSDEDGSATSPVRSAAVIRRAKVVAALDEIANVHPTLEEPS